MRLMTWRALSISPYPGGTYNPAAGGGRMEMGGRENRRPTGMEPPDESQNHGANQRRAKQADLIGRPGPGANGRKAGAPKAGHHTATSFFFGIAILITSSHRQYDYSPACI